MADTVNARVARWLRSVLGLLALTVVGGYASAVVVREGQSVLITRFGRPLRTAARPGLHWKCPWPVDEAVSIDMRRHVYETGHAEMLTSDKKNLIAQTFVVWRVGEPVLFAQAVGSQQAAEAKLDGLLTNATIGALGSHELSALVSTKVEELQTDRIEAELLQNTAPLARRAYGLVIDQVRIERVSLPSENVGAVFDQMRAERRQAAAKFQNEGEREASRIRSEGDLQAARIAAKGTEEEAKIRGEAAAEVARIYADAHAVDPQLYRFTRSLESLQNLLPGNASLILRTDSEPFSLLQRKPER